MALRVIKYLHWLRKRIVLLGCGLALEMAWAMDRDCSQFLKSYLDAPAPKALLAKLRHQPALQPLREVMAKHATYFTQPILACDSNARLEAWQKIWWGLNEAFALGHQWRVHPLLVLTAAGELRPPAVSRWMAFFHYARLPVDQGALAKTPTLAEIRSFARQQWPRGKVLRPEKRLADYQAVQPLWIMVSRYLERHPAKSFDQVLAALLLRQEISQHLREVAPLLGLLRPPQVAGLLAQTNSFKNQMRLLRQTVRQADYAALAKRVNNLRTIYGLSWLAIVDAANLAPDVQQKLWASEFKQAANSFGVMTGP